MIDDAKRIGFISAISGGTISAVFGENVVENAPPELEQAGKIGTYVIMEDGGRSVVGTISGLRTLEGGASANPFGGGGTAKHVMDIQLIGTLRNEHFERGAVSLPKLGSPVFAAGAEDISTVFSAFREHNFSLGT